MLGLLSAQDALAEQHAFAVSSQVDSLFVLDLDTGEVTNIGALGENPDRYTTPTALAIRPGDGEMFASNNSPDQDRGISRIDRETGRATLVVPWSSTIHALTFDSSNQLIAQLNTGYLAVVDISAGTITSIGDGAPGLVSLATNPANGFMYGLSLSLYPPSMVLLKLGATGAILDEVPIELPGKLELGSAHAFTPDGTLWVTTGRLLLELDPSTGEPISNPIEISPGFFPQGLDVDRPAAAMVVIPALSARGIVIFAISVAILGLGRLRSEVSGRLP